MVAAAATLAAAATVSGADEEKKKRSYKSIEEELEHDTELREQIDQILTRPEKKVKNRLCGKWLDGECLKAYCSDAHGAEEIGAEVKERPALPVPVSAPRTPPYPPPVLVATAKKSASPVVPGMDVPVNWSPVPKRKGIKRSFLCK